MTISAEESKKLSNHKIKALESIFNTINVNHMQTVLCIVRKCLCRFHHFLDSRVDICQKFRWFFGKFKTSKGHSEINWPVGVVVLVAVVIEEISCLLPLL